MQIINTANEKLANLDELEERTTPIRHTCIPPTHNQKVIFVDYFNFCFVTVYLSPVGFFFFIRMTFCARCVWVWLCSYKSEGAQMWFCVPLLSDSVCSSKTMYGIKRFRLSDNYEMMICLRSSKWICKRFAVCCVSFHLMFYSQINKWRGSKATW